MENDPATKEDVRIAVNAAVEASELRLLERIEAVETRLLTEFRKWAVPIQSSVKVQ